jgi:hypothetical protein
MANGRLRESKRGKVWATLIAAVNLWASAQVIAATHRYDVLFDLDRNVATGCTAGGASGLERIARVTVNTTTSAATVSAIERLDCVSGTTFGSPQAIAGAPYALTLSGAGTASAIELALPLASFPTNPDPTQPMLIRLGASSSAAGGATDSLSPMTDFQLRAATPNINGLSALPVNTTTLYWIGLLALLVGAIGSRAVRTNAGRALRGVVHSVAMGAVGVLLVFGSSAIVYAIVLDGNIGDWSGSQPLISDAEGDQPANADLIALYAKIGGGDLALRIDAVIALETVVVGNAAPVISGLADTSLTLPNFSLPFAPTVTDDGLPTPATMTYQWQRISGPQAVVFGVDSATPPDMTTAAAAVAAQSSTRKDVGAFFDFNSPGTYVLRFTASDGALSSSRDVAVTVNAAAAAAPAIGPHADRTIRLGETLSLSLSGRDANTNDTLTYSLPTAPNGAALNPGGSARFTFTPTAAQVGTHPVTISVRDAASATAQASFNITVLAANRAPKFTAPSYADASSSVGANFTRALAAVDPDIPETLTYSLVEGPSGMSVASGGALAWTPSVAQRGRNLVKIQVADSASNRDVKMFAIDVGNNVAPVARKDTYRVKVGETLTVNAAQGVLVNDIDPDGSALSAIKATNPDKGSLSAFNGDGSFTFVAPTTPTATPFAVRKKFTLPRNPYSWNGFNVGDVNGDGSADILISIQGGFAAYSGKDGSVLWSRGDEFGAFFGHTAGGTVLADIDDDGELEFVAFYEAGGGRPWADADALFAMNARTGATKWLGPSLTPAIADVVNQPEPIEGALERSGITVARLYADQKPKFLIRRNILASEGYYLKNDNTTASIGCMALSGREADRGRACRATFIVNHLGVTEEVLTAPNPYNEGAWHLNGGQYGTRVIAADLDNDGAPEIISGGDVYKRVNGVWTLSWTVPWQPQNVAVADLDGDGVLEVIHSYQGNPNSYDPNAPLSATVQPTGIHVFSQTGVLVRKIFAGHLFQGGYMTVADIDGDSSPDILVYNYGVMQAFRADGTPLWKYLSPNTNATVPPLTAQLGSDRRLNYPSTSVGPRINITVYDLDGDGVKEVIFWSNAGTTFLDGRDGRVKTIYGLSGGPSANPTYEITAVADVDGDGKADVVTVSGCPYSLFQSEAGYCDGQYTVLSAAGADWLPGPKIYPQLEYVAGQFEDNGYVNYNWSTRNSYRTPAQRGTARDPRTSQGTIFTYKASDGALESAETEVFIEIAPQNSPPVFTSTPPTAHLEDSSAGYPRLIYTATATDPDPGDTVRFELVYSGIDLRYFPPTTIDPVTGEMNMYSGSCGSFGGPCNFGSVFNVIAAVDSFGARTEQAFYIDSHSTVVAVPNVVGQTYDSAKASLEAVRLTPRKLSEVFNIAPPGTVLAQSPASGTPKISRSATVALTVSKGPEPVVVPNVVGLNEATARSRLQALGFTVQLTRSFSSEIPAQSVLSQSIAAGDVVVPLSIGVVSSAGNGLRLRLNREIMRSDSSITVTPETIGLSGEVTGTPSLSYLITPAQPHYVGPVPTIAANIITAGETTRGVFKITGTDTANSRTVEREFIVVPPSDVVWEEIITRLTEIEALEPQLIDARDRNDDAEMRDLIQQIINIWRRPMPSGSLLQDALPGATILQPSGGFAPSICEQRNFNRNPSPDDLLQRERNQSLIDKIKGIIANLQNPAGTLRDFNINVDAFRDAILQLKSFGTYADAPTGLADIQLMQWAASTGVNSMVDGIISQAEAVLRGGSSLRSQTELKTSLVELTVTTTVNGILATIADQTTGPVKQTVFRAMRQAAFSGAAIVANGWLRETLKGQAIQGVVTGASQSFHTFALGNSFIEIQGCQGNPINYDVLLVGPDLLESMIELIEKIKEGASFDRNEFANLLKWQNPFGRDLVRSDISKRLREIKSAAKDLSDVVIGAYQGPSETDFGCIFSADAACQQLVFGDGIAPVYTLKYGQNPPFPSAIITIVFDRAYGDVYLGTPLFFPVRKGLFQ